MALLRSGFARAWARLATIILVAGACSDAGPAAPAAGDVFQWRLPEGFPPPRVPADNPMTAAKVELGRHLFYDTRLSGNGTFSCARCHEQQQAFADGRMASVGSTGQQHPRNSMGLTNVAYASALTWANPDLRTLERQALVPMFGTKPVELGLEGRETELLARLRAEPRYTALFREAFPDPDPFTILNVTRALASFQRTLISGNSPYDQYQRGITSAISESARRGAAIFFGNSAQCFQCHQLPFFSRSTDFEGNLSIDQEFFNTGLYNVDGRGGYPAPNYGLYEFTGHPSDMGRFKVPTLRNIEVTSPYMHDGSIATLEDVVAHYEAGGRTIASGPNAGVGRDNPNKSHFVKGFTLTPQERVDLVAFLRSLTDEQFINDNRFSNPW